MTEDIVGQRIQALHPIAQEIEAKLRSGGHKPWKVAGFLSYGWPKIKVVFETDEEVQRLISSPQNAELSLHVAALVRSNPVFGEYGAAFKPEEALFVVQFPQ